MTFLVKTVREHHLWEGYGKSKPERKRIWLSGNDSCPISGENERIRVWPHLKSYSVLEVSVSHHTEKFALWGWMHWARQQQGEGKKQPVRWVLKLEGL